MRKIICSAICLLSSVAAVAQLSSSYTQCVQRAKKNTVQIGVCVQKETALQDGRLNRAYKARMRALSNPADQQSLKEEELAWIRLRDQKCKVNGDTVDTICLLRETSIRAAQLESNATSDTEAPAQNH